MPGYFASLFDPDQPRSFFGAPLLAEQFPPSDPPVSPSADGVAPASPAPASNPEPFQTQILAYPDGTPVLNHEGWPMLRPVGMDVRKNIEEGKRIAPLADIRGPAGEPLDGRDMAMVNMFTQGGSMDYQRPNGYFAAWLSPKDNYKGEYRDLGYYNYGAVAAAAGYSRDDAVQAAGLHNSLFSANGLSDDAEKNIKKGWDDVDGGRWSR